MAPTRRPLITERDVRNAARAGSAGVDAQGAAVTPSALDAARELGVTLRGHEPTSTATTRPPQPASAADPKAPTAGGGLRIAIGADHGGVAMKDSVLAALRERGHTVDDHGTYSTDPVDYPDFALAVARAVAGGRADLGIMIDGAGIGSCMVANRVPDVRAAMCHDVTTAANAREHNDANLLTLGGTLIGPRLALEIVGTFLATPYAGGRHDKRVDKIRALDRERLRGAGALPSPPHT